MKKVKFALVMKDGEEARSLEELREVFDLESVMEYLLDGRLERWLEDRCYEAEGKAVASLSGDGQDVGEKLCRIFQVPYDREKWEAIKARQEIGKLAMEYMENTDILGKISKLLGEKEPGKIEEGLASGTVSPQCVVSQILKDNRELHKYGSAKEMIADLFGEMFAALKGNGITEDMILSEMISRLAVSYPDITQVARDLLAGKFDDLFAANKVSDSESQPHGKATVSSSAPSNKEVQQKISVDEIVRPMDIEAVLGGEAMLSRYESEVRRGEVTPRFVVRVMLLHTGNIAKYASAKEMFADVFRGKGYTPEDLTKAVLRKYSWKYPSLVILAREFMSGKYDDVFTKDIVRVALEKKDPTPSSATSRIDAPRPSWDREISFVEPVRTVLRAFGMR